jgi:2-polyprenyl-3-methyl-5-hydroxy-6-metoxy-1,4-benzoquinol methylase
MSYFEGLNEKLLKAIPRSKKVLEFGCATGRLGERYKELTPSTCWHGVDFHASSLEMAQRRLDQVWLTDLDVVDARAFEDGYDCVVIGDVLEHLKQPERLLATVRTRVTADARLVCSIPNMTNISIIERMLIGDLSYDSNGLMDRTLVGCHT